MAYYEKSTAKKEGYNRLYITTIGHKADRIANDVFEKFGMKDSKKTRVSKGMFCDGQTAYKYCFICSDPDEVARVRKNVKNELLNNYILDVHTLQENRNGIFVLDRIIYEK